MQKKSIKVNLVYQIIYQIVITLVPIIITPYISRVLTESGIGQYHFALSITAYFVAFANLGFGYYGQREIARNQNNTTDQSKVFFEIFLFKLIVSLLASLVYIGVIQLSVFNDYKLFLYILIPNILSIGIDTTFLFQGNENFKQLAIRNAVIKIVYVVLIFTFVKKQNDLWIYTLLSSFSIFFSALFLIPFIRKYITRVRISSLNIRRHILPCLKLFVPVISATIYSTIDKTMIGFLVPGESNVLVDGVIKTMKNADVENGNYSNAQNVINIITALIGSLSTVLIPRTAADYKKGDMESVKSNIYKGIRFIYFLGIPALFGMILISKSFSSWFFGEGYVKIPTLLVVFSPFIFIVGINTVLRNQYVLAIGKDNVFTFSVLLGVIVNIPLNIFLIPKLGSIGAAISSVIAEFLMLLYLVQVVKEEISLKKMVSPIIKYFDAGLIMFIITYFISLFLPDYIISTFVILFSGAMIYFLLMILFREEFTLNVINKIKNVLLKKRNRDV